MFKHWQLFVLVYTAFQKDAMSLIEHTTSDELINKFSYATKYA